MWRLHLRNEIPHYSFPVWQQQRFTVSTFLWIPWAFLPCTLLLASCPAGPTCTRECAFVRARTPAWLCICASLFMPVKSCYRRQQQHCSPPMQPPWHKLPSAACSHDCPTLLQPFTFSSAWLAAEKQRRPSLAHSGPFAIVYCEAGEWIRHIGWSSIGTSWAKKQGDKLEEGEKRACVVFFSCSPPFFLFFPRAWLIPLVGSRSVAKRCTWKEVTVQSTRCGEWTVDLFTISFSKNKKKPSVMALLAEYIMFYIIYSEYITSS